MLIKMARKRKKNTRQRGSGSHGWGAKKSHRASGRRGGAGYSGTGKRADQMKPSIWHIKDFFGKHGFKKHPIKPILNAVNIKFIENNFEKLLNEKKIEKQGDKYHLNLAVLGFGKLLSEGIVKHKLVIECEETSQKAAEKIKAAGGEVIIAAKVTGDVKEKKVGEEKTDKE